MSLFSSVATSTANLLEARDLSDSDSEDDLSQFGRSKIVMTHSYFLTDSSVCPQSNGVGGVAGQGAGQGDEGLHAWLGVSWLIMYLMFVLFLLYKRKANVHTAVK